MSQEKKRHLFLAHTPKVTLWQVSVPYVAIKFRWKYSRNERPCVPIGSSYSAFPLGALVHGAFPDLFGILNPSFFLTHLTCLEHLLTHLLIVHSIVSASYKGAPPTYKIWFQTWALSPMGTLVSLSSCCFWFLTDLSRIFAPNPKTAQAHPDPAPTLSPCS